MATITINNDSQTNASISFVVLPLPSIIIQLPFNHPSNNGVNNLCEYCGSNLLQTNEKTEVKIDEKNIELKEELKDTKPSDNCIEEFEAMFDIDERLSNNDPNMYNNMFSPISITESIDTQTKQAYVPEYYDSNGILKERFQNIFDIVEYLKQDMIMN